MRKGKSAVFHVHCVEVYRRDKLMCKLFIIVVIPWSPGGSLMAQKTDTSSPFPVFIGLRIC